MIQEQIKWAKELKEQHPEVLKYYSQSEIKRIWGDYSHDLAAGWISHENLSDEAVKRVFDNYLILDHWEIYKRI